jgi:DnaJ-class molecular chaperone
MDEDTQCRDCEGTGKLDANCPECDGNGWVDDPSDGGTMTCPSCENDDCPSCGGTGSQ